MQRARVDPERPAPRKLAPAIEALSRDQVILYPSDTGYAFGCALSSRKAIGKIRTLKGHDERVRKNVRIADRDFAPSPRAPRQT